MALRLGSDVGEKITNPSTALVETLTVINDLIGIFIVIFVIFAFVLIGAPLPPRCRPADDMEENAEDSDLPDPLLPFADGFCQS